MEKTLFTINVFSENRVGLLNQISVTFTRRKLNIETLSVSPSSIKGVHKFTITTFSDKATMEKLVKQIEKRIEVLRAFFFTDDEIIYQEIALYKVPTVELLSSNNMEVIIRRHNARILEVTQDYTIVEKTGHTEETESLFNELKQYNITQFIRSGRIAITKSSTELVTQFIKEQQDRLNNQ